MIFEPKKKISLTFQIVCDSWGNSCMPPFGRYRKNHFLVCQKCWLHFAVMKSYGNRTSSPWASNASDWIHIIWVEHQFYVQRTDKLNWKWQNMLQNLNIFIVQNQNTSIGKKTIYSAPIWLCHANHHNSFVTQIDPMAGEFHHHQIN